ncbi:hypothetical protein FNZ56_00810 [Pseudoluteimonas lycopersici]|uniref:DUF1311 domain-containing protein n=1 Tax=Pseudoluteimonas lycopersici TaxID=1324796 RepID=A0A516V1X4_9GAMM|nr:hypothetical protein [Lysobacter lycopersici]QDQ72526.1 hypothetical protein FNZ56_00810 [Lysobacter lycopersici]
MAILRALMFALLSLAGIATAQAASFDCAKARTGVDKAVCADPKLSEYDERIAAAYKRELDEWNGAIRAYVRNDQRHWLSEIRRIDKNDSEIEANCAEGDLPCLRREYQLRTDEIESSGYRNSGVYQRSDGGGNLLVQAIRNADIRLRLYDRRNSKIIATAQDEAEAQRTGLPQLQRDTFQWDGPDTFILEAADADGQAPADGCALTVHFTEKAATVLQQGGCGGARLEGTYLRDLDDLLTNYEFSPD